MLPALHAVEIIACKHVYVHIIVTPGRPFPLDKIIHETGHGIERLHGNVPCDKKIDSPVLQGSHIVSKVIKPHHDPVLIGM